MEFLFPGFLWALFALLIPIIIHLFNFRRFKKVYFTNVKFLKEVKEETANRSRLKHWLVLLSRLFALAFLVLAFAQPFIPQDDKEVVTGAKVISVFLDNSFSMDALSNDVSLFEKAKQKAREIAAALGEEDRFHLITHDFEGKHKRLVSKEEFLGYIEDIKITPNVQTLKKVQARHEQVAEGIDRRQNNLFILSDFQENITDMEMDTMANYYLIPMQSQNQQNVYVDSCWFASPVKLVNETNKLIVKLSNTGNTVVDNSRMILKINGEQKALKEFNIAAGSQIIDTINFRITETGFHKAELNITDYPISFDDNYYFAFEVADKIKSLSINSSGENRYLKALYDRDDFFTLDNQRASNLDYAGLSNYQLIILNQLDKFPSGLAFELQNYLTSGGSVLLFPSANANLLSYNEFLRAVKANTYTDKVTSNREVNFINVKQDVFKNVFQKIPQNIDLPKASLSYNTTAFSATSEEQLLRFKDRNPMLSKYRVGDGSLYLSAVPLDNNHSTLPSHAVFPPMVIKMALLSGKNSQLAYTIGSNELIEVENKANSPESVFKLKGGEEEFIPGQKRLGNKLSLALNNQLKEAGIYSLYLKESEPLNFFGFNFDRKESILKYFSLDQLKARYSGKNITYLENIDEDFSKTVGELDRGFSLWWWCLVAVLAFLLIEVLLLRLLPD